ncbi:MAG: tetratricopeptide repeat protein [Rhizobiales bacterium]|nr:tetratricopeptide repeat protein [Hyphomicrobiales bacterium]
MTFTPDSRLEKNERVNRKLAAILAADVVGYSRLMGADEVGTLRALKAARKDCVDPSIASYGGRIVKTTGDGLLVEFRSVVDAVACAVTFQRSMLAQDGGAEKRIVFRVGINVGDIIIDAKDIFGDGVNIAARLESICEPGGLCVSDIAYDQVRDKLPLSFVDGGEQQVKNIARPVRIFGLSPQVIAAAPNLGHRRARAKPHIPILVAAALAAILLVVGGAWWAMHLRAPPQESPQVVSTEGRPSIAVLPLISLGADSNDDYFGDGLTEDIISALGRFPELVVRSRNAAFAYKGKTPRPEQVGRDLDVRYIVEGSIRRSRERIRISIGLTSAARATQLWSETYDIAPKDIFSVQDDITRRIAGTLASQLSNVELAKAATKQPSSLEAYDVVLRGRDMFARVTRSANSEARVLFKRAIELDPNYAPAYVGLGRVELAGVVQGWTADPGAAIQRAQTLAQKAIGLDPGNAGAHSLLGSSYIRYGDYDRALDEMQRAVKLNGSDPTAYAGLATAFLWSGNAGSAIRSFETAVKLGLNITVNDAFLLGMAYLLVDRNADAIRVIERSLDTNRTDVFTRAVLAAAYAEDGQQDKATRQTQEVRTLNPRFDSADFGSLLRKPDLRAKLTAAMVKAGL